MQVLFFEKYVKEKKNSFPFIHNLFTYRQKKFLQTY